jgi:hypothetical protein
MATSYTSLLGLALPQTGDLSGTWGATVNTSITQLLDEAVAGTTTLSADTTLTTTTGASNQARQAILLCTGHSANITITAPAQSKIYTVINASATYTVKIRGAGPTTGITIPVSSTATVAWNGSDFVDASGYINGNLKVNGTLTVTGTATIGGNTAITGTLSATGATTLSAQLTASTGDGTYPIISKDTRAFSAGVTGPQLGFFGLDSTSTNNSLGAFRALAQSSQNGTLEARVLSSGSITTIGTFSSTGLAVTGTSALTLNRSGSQAQITLQNNSVSTGILIAGVTNGLVFYDAAAGQQMGTWAYSAGLAVTGTLSATTSITSIGSVGNVYTDSTGARLNFSRGADNYFQASTAGGYFAWIVNNSGSNAMTLNTSGNLGIGYTTINTTIAVNGNALFGTGAWPTSDFGRSGSRFVNASSTEDGILVVSNMQSGVAANRGGYLYLGARATTGVDGATFATIAGLRENATSGNYSTALTFNTSTSAGAVTERARIDSSGNLLVGKTSSAATTVGWQGGQLGEFYVTKSTSTDADATYYLYSTGASAYRFYVGLGGTVFATSIVITAISDERLKENVRDIDTGLSSIMALKPRRFDWKEGKGQDKKNVAGFIAQEFEDVFPECVSTSKAGEDGIEYKNINHETLIPTLVKAIQELKAEIDSLKSQLNGA